MPSNSKSKRDAKKKAGPAASAASDGNHNGVTNGTSKSTPLELSAEGNCVSSKTLPMNHPTN